MYAANDQFGTDPHGIDHMGKAAEKFQAFFFGTDSGQFIKRSSGTKCFLTETPDKYNACFFVITGSMDRLALPGYGPAGNYSADERIRWR
jgi:hypothetical protein